MAIHSILNIQDANTVSKTSARYDEIIKHNINEHNLITDYKDRLMNGLDHPVLLTLDIEPNLSHVDYMIKCYEQFAVNHHYDYSRWYDLPVVNAEATKITMQFASNDDIYSFKRAVL